MMAYFKIVGKEMYAVMSEEEYIFIAEWIEEHKDNLDVQEIVKIGEEMTSHRLSSKIVIDDPSLSPDSVLLSWFDYVERKRAESGNRS